jgi:hypothetical protein
VGLGRADRGAPGRRVTADVRAARAAVAARAVLPQAGRGGGDQVEARPHLLRLGRRASLSNLLCELGQLLSFCYITLVSFPASGSDGDAVGECDGECIHNRFPAVSACAAFSSFADQPVTVDMPAGDIPDPEVQKLYHRLVGGEMTRFFVIFRSWKLIDSIALVRWSCRSPF